MNEFNAIRTVKVDSANLEIAKAIYNGSFALELENVSRIAAYATSVIQNDLPKDFYKTFLQKLNLVTVSDIQRVATKYFGVPASRIAALENWGGYIKNISPVSPLSCCSPVLIISSAKYIGPAWQPSN